MTMFGGSLPDESEPMSADEIYEGLRNFGEVCRAYDQQRREE